MDFRERIKHLENRISARGISQMELEEKLFELVYDLFDEREVLLEWIDDMSRMGGGIGGNTVAAHRGMHIWERWERTD